MKAKKVLKLSIEFEKNNDVNKTIEYAKPPIFWKDKEIVKTQLNKWKSNKIKKLIYQLNDIEHQIKKNFQYSLEWKKNQLAIWDNRSMLHQATPFNGKRKMYRITIK